MEPLFIEIYDPTLIQAIKEHSASKGESPLQYVQRLVIEDQRKRTEIDLSDVNKVCSALRQAYALEYRQRFDVEPPFENGEATRLLTSAIQDLMKDGLEVRTVYDKLRRAITWYLNFHDNQDANGQNFPYGIKYLFSKSNNSWLLRTCLESSYKLDDKVFKLIQQGLSREEALRAIRRGDKVGSAKQVSRVALLDEALKMYAMLKKKYGKHLPSDFKFKPTIAGLFKSETPSEEYIKSAMALMMSLQSSLAKHEEQKRKSVGESIQSPNPVPEVSE